MQATELVLDDAHGWKAVRGDVDAAAQLVLCFGPPDSMESQEIFDSVRSLYRSADVVLCSAGGEILDEMVYDGTAVAVALNFSKTAIRCEALPIADAGASAEVGAALAAQISHADLRHVIVFAEGLGINGTDLATGLVGALPSTVTVSGGLAGDGERFERTAVGLNGPARPGQVVAIGLYGDALEVGMGSLGGWDASDFEMKVTRSVGNVVHELDGEPALAVYKRLIGARAYGLPATGLLYPLQIQSESGRPGVTRTLLAVDDEANTLTFAGDVREGRRVKLLQANLERLIEAAGGAASSALTETTMEPEFVLLVSCIGRKLVMQQRSREEVSNVRDAVGAGATLAGFYSYGELSPLPGSSRCELLNQTMTITTFAERL